MLHSFKHYWVFLVIALVVGTVLLSNKAGVNLSHHHTLPQLDRAGKVSCSGIFSQTCHIRLDTGIKSPEVYQEMLHVINTAKSGDTIYLHLIGNGGLVSSTVQINNVIKQSKAKIITVVEGDVYSVHAFIALMGDEVKIGEGVVFLFHITSAYGQYEEYCANMFIKPDGTHVKDRTQSSYVKCMDFYRLHVYQNQALAIKLFSKVLTETEMYNVLHGHDIILTGEEIKRRLNK